jgi:outer membrane protein OmpA-like peptidoglycan-associated protein
VVQQRSRRPGAEIDGGSWDPAEAAADRAADRAVRGDAVPAQAAGGHAAIQRKLLVDNPSATPAGAPKGTTNATVVEGYIKTLCPDFGVSAGKVAPTGGSCLAPGKSGGGAESCGCLCAIHNAADDWTIVVNDADWPHTDPIARTVTVHSGFSGVGFGAWTKGPGSHRMMYQNWLVLAHEMCGHAQLFIRGTHPAGSAKDGGRPSHDPTIAIENKIAAEHAIGAADQRGLFADPHHGESVARVSVAEFPADGSSVASLPAAQAGKLETAKNFLLSAPVEADVAGHTDATGDAAGNARVSLDRAKAVKDELVGRGVPAARFVDVRGVGSTECAGKGSQPACRKVDVFMYILRGGSITKP